MSGCAFESGEAGLARMKLEQRRTYSSTTKVRECLSRLFPSLVTPRSVAAVEDILMQIDLRNALVHTLPLILRKRARLTLATFRARTSDRNRIPSPSQGMAPDPCPDRWNTND